MGKSDLLLAGFDWMAISRQAVIYERAVLAVKALHVEATYTRPDPIYGNDIPQRLAGCAKCGIGWPCETRRILDKTT